MHICYVADARSPIAKNWISWFVARDHRVTVISSYPCAADEIPNARIIRFPIALSSLSGTVRRTNHSAPGASFQNSVLLKLRAEGFLNATQRVRNWIAPLDIVRKKAALSRLIDDLKPDIVHAMRLPFEGFIAAASVRHSPLLLSVWGNDFTLFANRNRRLATLTGAALQRSDGLHCDCNRDLALAFRYGFQPTKPTRVIPGNGGVRQFFFEARPDRRLLHEFLVPDNAPLIINPRGFRTYVHNESFFRAVPLVLRKIPEAFFLGVGMDGSPTAERWIRRLNVAGSVRLLPTVCPEKLACLFAASQVSVSPSSHDGTPNTLLEAMAAGCFPVAGDIDSLHEWIVDGENGLLCNPSDPHALATCMVRVLKDSDLRVRATTRNRSMIEERANYQNVMEDAETFYHEVIAKARAARTFQAASCPSGAEIAVRMSL